jgi:glutathione S-transferase
VPYSYPLTALVTLIAVIIYAWTGTLVARARVKYDIKAPAIAGNPDFERVFRVQANTGEQLLQFLPCLWLFAASFGDLWAAAIGVIWPIGRIVYAVGYIKAAEKRGPGFGLSVLPTVILAAGALVGIIRRFV